MSESSCSMNPRYWSFDLEMNQPSGNIIQIGGVIGNLYTGEVLSTFKFYIPPNEPLNQYITQLTGITEEDLKEAVSLDYAWDQIQEQVRKFHANVSPLVWGGGDLWAVKKALTVQSKIYKEYNIKDFYQLLRIAARKTPRGGLETAMQREEVPFVGRAHDALVDARNTFTLAHHLITKVGSFENLVK